MGSVPNACGDCLLGSFGGRGPSNAYCLANTSCAAVYPGLDTCPIPGPTNPYNNPQLPLVLPFGKCVCDDGNGFRWPTAAGKCARLRVEAEEGSGYFAVERCSTPTCEPASCKVFATWAPITLRKAVGLQFNCQQTGSDSAALLDRCADAVGTTPDSAFCGHPGLVNAALETTPDHILKCEVAPRCPASVLATNLEESCCLGADQSFVLLNGSQRLRAAGFCAREPPSDELFGKSVTVEIFSATGFRDADSQLQGNTDAFCEGGLVGKPATKFTTKTVNDEQSPTFDMLSIVSAPQAEDVFEFRCWDRDYGESDDALGYALLPSDLWAKGFEGEVRLNGTSGAEALLKVRIALLQSSSAGDCAVRTNAPGWSGCACLGVDGLPLKERVCSVTCGLDGCGKDGSGIPPTPEAWRTSDIPGAFYGQVRSARIASGAARRAPALALLAALLAAPALRRPPP